MHESAGSLRMIRQCRGCPSKNPSAGSYFLRKVVRLRSPQPVVSRYLKRAAYPMWFRESKKTAQKRAQIRQHSPCRHPAKKIERARTALRGGTERIGHSVLLNRISCALQGSHERGLHTHREGAFPRGEIVELRVAAAL